jgi:TonB-dependent receptor
MSPRLRRGAFLFTKAHVALRMLRSAPALLGMTALLIASAPPLSAQAAETGLIEGTVGNAAAGRMLEGAVVEIPKLRISTLTDQTGAYVLPGVPAGRHELTVSYTGLTPAVRTVEVTGNGRIRENFDLFTDLLVLDRFVVTGEREGNAAAITRQRNADSVKHVVSMDAFGNLANDNAGELLMRLPGLAGVHDLDGNIAEVNIRGTASNLNMVTVDGNLMASNFGDSRSFALRSISGALFDEIEVTKAPTPDMPADSIGGAVNFKSASPLDMKDKRRLSLGLSLRWTTRSLDNVPLAYDHPLHPTIKMNWQEVFNIFGGRRNLGVSVNAFYSENASGGFTGTHTYEDTMSRRAYMYDYQARDLYNNRKQKSISTKFDLRLSRSTVLNLGVLYNEDDQPFNYQLTMRAVTSARSLVTFDDNGNPTGSGTIYPDYTESFTRVRGLPTSLVRLTSTLLGFYDRQWNFNLGARHKFDRIQINYDAAYSQSHSILDTGEHGNRVGGGTLNTTITGIGWSVDRGDSETRPTWTMTDGRDISNPLNYTPGNMTRRDNRKNIDILSAKGHIQYALPTSIPVVLKSGFSLRSQEMRRTNADRRWDPVSTSAGSLAHLYIPGRIRISEQERIGQDLPFLDPADIAADLRDNPNRWREDIYYSTSRRLIGNDTVGEDVWAGFLQGLVKWGGLKVLAGARYERTSVHSRGYTAVAKMSTTAERAADPVGTAIADYGNYMDSTGDYDNWFPGVYVTYPLTRNLQLRVNWSNSIGRPSFTTLVPSFTVSDTAGPDGSGRVTINNPGLGPQTSMNWDIGLEYYFKHIGEFSVNAFRKDMSDFIVTAVVGQIGSGPDNGFGGDYEGYWLYTSMNGGDAKIEGYEIGYQQRFEFLPKFLSGLSFYGTYTWLRTEGDYGNVSDTPPSTKDVVDFIPETINMSLRYAWRGFRASVTWNRTGRYLNSYNAAPSQLRYTIRRDTWDASVSYTTRGKLTFFADVRNISNSPRSWERAAGITNAYVYFIAVNFGIRANF